jgi:hypothetical protein
MRAVRSDTAHARVLVLVRTSRRRETRAVVAVVAVAAVDVVARIARIACPRVDVSRNAETIETLSLSRATPPPRR